MAVMIRSCVGVDIGTHSIRAAAMEMGKAGPRVVSLLEEAIALEPGQSESQRHQAIAKQLQELLKRGGVRTKNAIFCVPGQSVFVRRIKLPKTTPEKMGRLVRFAAREQIPFPLDKTIMEYQVFGDEEAQEADVLLVAVKREFILNFMRLVRRTGLRPLAVSVSSLALFNFHELNDSTRDLTLKGIAARSKGDQAAAEPKKKDEKKKKKGKKGAAEPEPEPQPAVAPAPEPIEALGFEEIKAFVNLGSSLMDLAIPKPGAGRMIGFTRSVPLAGAEMDRAIRERLGLASLAQARAVKERETAVLSTDFEIAGDSEKVNMEASEAVTGVADRLIGELRRSLDFFISQPDGVAVDRVVLSGGLSKLRYLSSYIEEKTGLPVEVAAAHHAQLRLPEAFTAPISPFAVAIGLGLQGLGLAQNRIDFLPEELKSVRGLRERRNELIGMVAMLAVMILMSLNVGNNYVSTNRDAARDYEQIYEQNRVISERLVEARDRDTQVTDAYEQLSKAYTWRDYWFEFLQVFHAKRPPELLVDKLVLRIDGIVDVAGVSPNRFAVNQFLDELKSLDGSGSTPTPKVFDAKLYKLDTSPHADDRFPNPVLSYRMLISTYKRSTRIRALGEMPAPSPTPVPITR
jgi:Tfp pilus assembly PilM family ATPase